MVYCGQCGGRVYEEDRFCGGCGADVPRHVNQSVFDDPSSGRRIEGSQRSTPGASTISRGPDHSGARGPVLLLSSIAVLVILLGAGVFALIRLDPLGSMAGEVEPPAAGDRAGAPEGAVPLSTIEEETYPGPAQTEPDPTVVSPPEETIEDGEQSVGANGFVTEEEAVEEAISSHYNAIGDNDLAEAYSYFSSNFQSNVPQQGWIEEQQTFDITDSAVYSTEVEQVEGSSATASVQVGFEDNTGSPAFAITWELVKEGGQWKLDEQADAEKIR